MSNQTSKPDFSQGWGIAGLITAMAVGAFLLAGYIKSSTYRNPRDQTAPGSSAAHAPAAAASHDAAPAPEAAKH